VRHPEPAGAGDGVAQRDGPVMLEQDERGGRVVWDLVDDVPGLLVGVDLYALVGGLSAGGCAGLEPFLALAIALFFIANGIRALGSWFTADCSTGRGPDLRPARIRHVRHRIDGGRGAAPARLRA
jgi:hypothetical protein